MAEWIRCTEGRHECSTHEHMHADGLRATWRFESGGVGSYYCDACKRRIEANLSRPAKAPPEPRMPDSGAGAKTAIVGADETVLNAMRGYLRLSRNGGMPRALSDKIEAAVADAARLQYFSVALAVDAQAKALSFPTVDN